jgi:holdfast attachment protein HfaA
MPEAKFVRPHLTRLPVPVVVAACAAAALACASVANAQGMNGSSSQYNAGYGGSQFNRGVDVSTRDENNNQVFINGRMDTPIGSVFSKSSGVSRSSSSGGVGGGGLATAIGNNLNVVVQGSWNRVVVDSTQINNGDVSAQTSLNGSLNLQ